MTVIDTITGAGSCSSRRPTPRTTSRTTTTTVLYFRTAPPDVLQARALADLVINDGNNSVGILALNDPYGTGLAENTKNNLIASGLAEEDVIDIIYDPQARTTTPRCRRWSTSNPDAIVVIGFEESARIIEGSQRPGHRPAAD